MKWITCALSVGLYAPTHAVIDAFHSQELNKPVIKGLDSESQKKFLELPEPYQEKLMRTYCIGGEEVQCDIPKLQAQLNDSRSKILQAKRKVLEAKKRVLEVKKRILEAEKDKALKKSSQKGLENHYPDFTDDDKAKKQNNAETGIIKNRLE